MSGTTATEDQASDHSAQTRLERSEFQLDVTEEPPTPDQLESIIQYLEPSKIPMIVKGARTQVDAMKKLKEDPESFQRPVTVDWEHGRAVTGDNESEILKMIEGLGKK
ncbi:Thioredoxin-like protein [Venustampulla echinocandica]|uniref:Thioredoxin-like protein n=1 Tax=Venustampulla echinocandica TaxID=2656787 RepID=A0A370TZN3_9HELO|nr:Thioredoxin-like protein [Venustampulla echinocandica]RDL40989.1 Thioredoxin-like protein [Venustampulla echinocandica]